MFMLENTLKQNPCSDLHNHLIAVPHVSFVPIEQLGAASAVSTRSTPSPNVPGKGFNSVDEAIPAFQQEFHQQQLTGNFPVT